MTTPVCIEKVLRDHLEELSKAEFKTFQWYLRKAQRGGCKTIPRAQLENASIEETVDKLVQVYGEDGGLKTTVEILLDMNHNNLATKLHQAIKNPNVQQRLHEQWPTRCADWTSITHGTCRCEKGYTQGRVCPKVENAELMMDFSVLDLTENNGERSPVNPPGGQISNSESCQIPSKIKEKRDTFERVEQFCDSSIEQIKRQRRDMEQKIKDDFEKLQLFLKTEEATRIAALEEEETQKIGMMQKIKEISRDTFSLSDTVKEMEELGADDPFIENFSTEMERAQTTLLDPQRLPQTLIDVSKHVENLQLRVSEKMLNDVKNTPEVPDSPKYFYDSWGMKVRYDIVRFDDEDEDEDEFNKHIWEVTNSFRRKKEKKIYT